MSQRKLLNASWIGCNLSAGPHLAEVDGAVVQVCFWIPSLHEALLFDFSSDQSDVVHKILDIVLLSELLDLHLVGHVLIVAVSLPVLGLLLRVSLSHVQWVFHTEVKYV